MGRAASIISLSALAIVVFQCLWAVYLNKDRNYVEASPEDFDHSPSVLRKFAALGSIGFATGSQKVCTTLAFLVVISASISCCLTLTKNIFEALFEYPP